MSRLSTDQVSAAPSSRLRTIIYGGAPMHLETCSAAWISRPKFAQIYGQGDVPMTITALSKEFTPTAPGRRCARSWARSDCRASMLKYASPTTGIGGAAGRRNRRSPGSRRSRDGRLLKKSEATAETLRSGLLHPVIWRRSTTRVPSTEGPIQGSDHQRRQQHLSARSRRSAAAPSAIRGFRHRPPASGVGGGSGRLQVPRPERNSIRRRTRCALPFRDRAVKRARGYVPRDAARRTITAKC